jgi:hypothetical protein
MQPQRTHPHRARRVRTGSFGFAPVDASSVGEIRFLLFRDEHTLRSVRMIFPDERITARIDRLQPHGTFNASRDNLTPPTS